MATKRSEPNNASATAPAAPSPREAAGEREQLASQQPVVDLAENAPDPDALPHESDQQPDSQAPAARQDQTREAQSAYQDAKRKRPDTSAAPQLQQPSPNDTDSA